MRIWFNHWFSTAYHLIRMMREGTPEAVFVGSNENVRAIYRQACDEWYAEPALEENAYVEFCLQFCREHAIDIFVPRRGLTVLAANRSRFAAQGVRLLAGDKAELMAVLDDKWKTYEFFQEYFPRLIPPAVPVHCVAEGKAAYAKLREDFARVIYKLTVDEGAQSFRVIDEQLEQGRNALFNRPGSKITPAAAEHILSQYDFSVPLLFMPYLDGPEISADCLATAQGNIVIPRYKNHGRFSEIIFDAEIMAICERIMKVMGLSVPMNIQLRMHKGKPYLLEINPRMSGGLQLSCCASGINLPSLALRQLLGDEPAWRYPDFHRRMAAHIETPICLDEGER